MRAAAPYIDDLLPVHNLAALVDLARHLNGLDSGRAVRRQRHAEAPEPIPAATAAAAPAQRSWHRDASPSFRHPMWGRGSQERQG